MRVVYNGEGVANQLGGPTLDYDGYVAIERRGSSSQRLFPKKGYGFELRDGDGEDVDAPLLGMPAEEDWVLHGPYSDKTLIHNAFAYQLTEGLPYYQPRTRFVELVLGGEYWGVYLLTERIKRDKVRLDIGKMEPADTTGDDLTGGYILKIDNATAEDPAVPASFSLPPANRGRAERTTLLYHYPKPRDISAPQAAYIREWMAEFEARLAADDFEDPVTGYAPVIDERSFIDYLLVSELTRNVDAYFVSTYLYKERDSDGGRLHMGPQWDHNLSFGNAQWNGATLVDQWGFITSRVPPDYSFPFWWERLWSSEGFRARTSARWDELRQEGGAISNARVFGLYDSLATLVGGEVAERNFERWPVLGQRTWPNSRIATSHEDAVAYVRDYVERRLAWMDEQLGVVVSVGARQHAARTIGIYPSPGSGDRLYLTGLDHEDYPASLSWYDAVGRVLAPETTLVPGQAIAAPDGGGAVSYFSVRTRDGEEATGRWVRQ